MGILTVLPDKTDKSQATLLTAINTEDQAKKSLAED
jgi:hypothetical protein